MRTTAISSQTDPKSSRCGQFLHNHYKVIGFEYYGVDVAGEDGGVEPEAWGLRDTRENRSCLRRVAGDASRVAYVAGNGSIVLLQQGRGLNESDGNGFVAFGNTTMGRVLVVTGYARVDRDAVNYLYCESYVAAAEDARRQGVGGWGCPDYVPPRDLEGLPEDVRVTAEDLQERYSNESSG